MSKNSFFSVKHLKLFKISALSLMILYAISIFTVNIIYYTKNVKEISALPKITFGIDIVGGHQLTVAIDTSGIIEEQKNNNREYIYEYCKEKQVECKVEQQNNDILLTVSKQKENKQNDKKAKENKKQFIRQLRQIFYNYDVEFINGGDLNNFSISIKTNTKTIEKIIADATDKAITVLKNRIDGVGVKEIAVQRYGQDKIVILIPSGVNVEGVKSIINTTAKLNFHLMDGIHIFNYKPKEFSNKRLLLPSYKDGEKQTLYYLVEKKPSLGGDCMANVQPSIDGFNNAINFRLNSKGTKKFAEITKNNIGRLLAIVLDDKVLMAPKINTPIIGGSGSITGNFTIDEVQKLSVLLKSGSLPAKITIINEKQLGSIFDKQVLSSAFIAVLICMTCVLLVMVARYRHFGCIAFIALILNFLFTFSILSLFGFTLTLPGIAGFVLMLGMAIDANILIYEKMKDLKRQGVNMPDTLIKNSCSKAIGTILDSNITTMIAGIALFSFGGSFIKGFSITLIFGLLCSIFTSVNITRMIIEEIYKNRKTISI